MYRVRSIAPKKFGYYSDEKEEWVNEELSGGFEVYRVEDDMPVDGRSLYKHKQSAYRRCRQLNHGSSEII